MQPKNPLFQKCLAYLETLPNIQVTIQGEPYFSSEVLADGQLTISTSHHATDYVCEIKTGLTNDIVGQTLEYFTNLGKRLKLGQRPLLITRNLSSLVVDQLLNHNIEFIDVDGNIYLNSPDVYILVRNQAPKESTNKSLEITAATLQVMYVLLNQPKLFVMGDSADEKIASIAGVTSKTVKITLKKLQDLEYIRQKQGGYQINDYMRLLERWELGYAERLRAKLLIETFRPIENRNFSDIENQLPEYAKEYGYLIGGELAASMITNYVRPIGATLHFNTNKSHFLALKLKLKPDPEGTIFMLQNFGGDNYHKGKFGLLDKNIANPLLIHAELMRSGDSRLKETAVLVYDKYIEEIAQKND